MNKFFSKAAINFCSGSSMYVCVAWNSGEVRLEYEKRIREGRDSHHFGKSCIEFQTNINHTKSEIFQ